MAKMMNKTAVAQKPKAAQIQNPTAKAGVRSKTLAKAAAFTIDISKTSPTTVMGTTDKPKAAQTLGTGTMSMEQLIKYTKGKDGR